MFTLDMPVTDPVQVTEILVLHRHKTRWRSANDIAILGAPFIVRWGKDVITVPAGFATDGASVPRFVPGVLARSTDGLEAAIVHDWIYRNGARPREYGDRLFYQMLLLDSNVPTWRASAMYGAVRLFGASSYKA